MDSIRPPNRFGFRRGVISVHQVKGLEGSQTTNGKQTAGAVSSFLVGIALSFYTGWVAGWQTAIVPGNALHTTAEVQETMEDVDCFASAAPLWRNVESR